MAQADAQAVIELVARLIDDAAFGNVTAEAVYAALQRHEWEARYLALTALETKIAGATSEYKTFVAPHANWAHFEDSLVAYDAQYNVITPATADYTRCRLTFTTEPTRPVYVLGVSHDPYAAAADLLETRASQLAEKVQSFTSLNGSFSFGLAMRDGPLQLAQKYRAQSRAASALVEQPRSDLNPFHG